jgi:hypothetical protein
MGTSGNDQRYDDARLLPHSPRLFLLRCRLRPLPDLIAHKINARRFTLAGFSCCVPSDGLRLSASIQDRECRRGDRYSEMVQPIEGLWLFNRIMAAGMSSCTYPPSKEPVSAASMRVPR